MSGLNLSQEFMADINEVAEIHEAYLESLESSGVGLPQEGVGLALITGYVELGEHANSKGKVAPRARMRVEIFDIEGEEQKYSRKVTEEVNGEQVTRTAGTVMWHNFMNISRNDNSNYRQELDKVMEAIGVNKDESILRHIGKVFKVAIKHDVVDDKTTYANMQLKTCTPATGVSSATGLPDPTKPLALPADMHSIEPMWFTFYSPTAMAWKSIEIEGTYTTKDKDGKEVEKSKNYLQEMIKSALNFQGSPVESLLMKAGNTGTPLPTAKKAKDVVKDETPVEATPTAPVVEVDPALLQRKAELEQAIATMKNVGADASALEAQLAQLGV